MLRPCEQVVDCPDDFVGNFSSEADDTLDFLSTKFAPAPPKINNLWTRIGCGTTCVSHISQADADQCAAAAVALCTQQNCQDGCDPIPTFCNAPVISCARCVDGTPTCFGVDGGVFCGYPNQAAADQAALNFAGLQAQNNPVCPGPLPPCTCVGDGYLGEISNGIIVTWTLIGGSLPPGLTFAGGTGFSTSIFGIPTTNGTYTFQIKAQNVIGAFAIKTYTITVLEITTTQLDTFTIGTPYSFQLQAAGGSGNYNWRIVSGTLPNGLTLSLTGLISGTPV